MTWSALSTSSLVFLILYAGVFVSLNYLALVTHTISLKSRWALLYFHVLVRLAAQGCGIAFGITGLSNTDLLVAFLVLAAEGYFTLVLCGYRFLVVWHQCNLPNGVSFLEARQDGAPFFKRFLHSLSITEIRKSPLNLLHIALIVANSLIISGGSQLASDYASDRITQAALDKSIALRSAGQAIFLAGNIALLASIVYTFNLSRRQLGRIHPTLWLLNIASPFLIVRGIYGVLQAANKAGNLFDDASYESGALSRHFVLEESLMATLMEWSACALFLATVYTARHDPRKESDPAPGSEEVSSEDGHELKSPA